MAKERNTGADEADSDVATPMWALEDLYPSVSDLLRPSLVKGASDPNVLIVLDTNVLLLPFKVGGREFSEIKAVFTKLAEEGRLRVPDRVIREYLKNRDTHLGSILKSVQDKASAVLNVGGNLPHFFKDLDVANPVLDADVHLKQAGRDYAKALQPLIDQMKAWRGDDPVTLSYQKIFGGEVVVKYEADRAQVAQDWKARLDKKVPPGYKDAGKPDKGIGDFLIWLTILEIGNSSQKDVIFVTGEEKADWLVRSGNEGVYPRPELIDEFRRKTSGKNLRLLKLADLLREVGVAEGVVEDVRDAEALDFTDLSDVSADDDYTFFDYSTNNGEIRIGSNNYDTFDLKFSKASDTSIHVYATNGTKVARCKNIGENEAITFEQFDSSSRVYTVHAGEVFLVRNSDGSTMAARIKSISDDSRGASRDHVSFSHRAFIPGQRIVSP